ncbi:MAG: hypothetical protein AB7O37_21975 [Vicinamibacteria bacterium]
METRFIRRLVAAVAAALGLFMPVAGSIVAAFLPPVAHDQQLWFEIGFGAGALPFSMLVWKLVGRRVGRPPGVVILNVADFICSPRTLERVVAPIVADLQLEYFNALEQKRPWKARWIRVRYAGAMIVALTLSAARAISGVVKAVKS